MPAAPRLVEGAGDLAPACGDALRIRFVSTRSLFAPAQRETECGVHLLTFTLPPDAPLYDAEVLVVHINGEGMADPSSPRLFPFNLVNKQDGPDIYNLPVEGFKGKLRIPSSYLSDPTSFLDSYALRSASSPLHHSASAHPWRPCSSARRRCPR